MGTDKEKKKNTSHRRYYLFSIEICSYFHPYLNLKLLRNDRVNRNIKKGGIQSIFEKKVKLYSEKLQYLQQQLMMVNVVDHKLSNQSITTTQLTMMCLR